MFWRNEIIKDCYELLCNTPTDRYTQVGIDPMCMAGYAVNTTNAFKINDRTFRLKEQSIQPKRKDQECPEWALYINDGGLDRLIGTKIDLGDHLENMIVSFQNLFQRDRLHHLLNHKNALRGLIAQSHPHFNHGSFIRESIDVYDVHGEWMDEIWIYDEEAERLSDILSKTMHLNPSGMMTNGKSILIEKPNSNHERLLDIKIAEEIFSKTMQRLR